MSRSLSVVENPSNLIDDQIKHLNWHEHRVSQTDKIVLSVLLKTFPKTIQLYQLAAILGISRSRFISHYKWGTKDPAISKLEHSATRLANLGLLKFAHVCAKIMFDENGQPIYPVCDYCENSPIAGDCTPLLLKDINISLLRGGH
jgi:hypothetical protein